MRVECVRIEQDETSVEARSSTGQGRIVCRRATKKAQIQESCGKTFAEQHEFEWPRERKRIKMRVCVSRESKPEGAENEWATDFGRWKARGSTRNAGRKQPNVTSKQARCNCWGLNLGYELYFQRTWKVQRRSVTEVVSGLCSRDNA